MKDKGRRAIKLPDDRNDFLEWAASVDEGVPSVGGLAVRSEIVESHEGTDEDASQIVRWIESERELQELANQIAHRDSRLSKAAARLATQSESTTQLDPENRAALEEFAQALAEATN